VLTLPGLAGAFADAGLFGLGLMYPLPGGFLCQTSLPFGRLFGSSPTLAVVSGYGQIIGGGRPQACGTELTGRPQGQGRHHDRQERDFASHSISGFVDLNLPPP